MKVIIAYTRNDRTSFMEVETSSENPYDEVSSAVVAAGICSFVMFGPEDQHEILTQANRMMKVDEQPASMPMYVH